MYLKPLPLLALSSLLCTGQTASTSVKCSTKLGNVSHRNVPTTTTTTTTTKTATATTTHTPTLTVTLPSSTQYSYTIITQYDQTITDSSTTLSVTTFTVTPVSYTSTQTYYTNSYTTVTSYSAIPAPSGWLPIEDTTSSVYPKAAKREIGHPHGRRTASSVALAAVSTTQYPQDVKCNAPFLPTSLHLTTPGTKIIHITTLSISTITASKAVTDTLSPALTSIQTIIQYAPTTVFPALTTYTVTATTTALEVTYTTDTATLTATLTIPTFAACSITHELYQVTFPSNSTIGAPRVVGTMGNFTDQYLITSYGGVNVDCCGECFAAEGCTGAYTLAGMFSPQVCYLFIDATYVANGGVCSQKAVEGVYQWESEVGINESMGPFETVYNGECGWFWNGGWNGL